MHLQVPLLNRQITNLQPGEGQSVKGGEERVRSGGEGERRRGGGEEGITINMK